MRTSSLLAAILSLSLVSFRMADDAPSADPADAQAVSYTHLTLPTICSV